MATAEPQTETDESTPSPPGYRPVDLTGLGDRRWIHEETGLAVDIMRYARHRTAQDVMPDHYQYKLVIRPDGPDGGGRAVASATAADSARVMATEWMAEHPDGEAPEVEC